MNTRIWVRLLLIAVVVGFFTFRRGATPLLHPTSHASGASTSAVSVVHFYADW